MLIPVVQGGHSIFGGVSYALYDLVASGTSQDAATLTFSTTVPADCIMVLVVACDGTQPSAPSEGGWSLLTSGGVSAAYTTTYWKLTTGDTTQITGLVNGLGSGDSMAYVAGAWQGLGTETGAARTATNSGASSTINFPDAGTADDESLVIAAWGGDDDVTSASTEAPTGYTLVAFEDAGDVANENATVGLWYKHVTADGDAAHPDNITISGFNDAYGTATIIFGNGTA